MTTVVTVKSVKKTFIDFVDVVDASDESDADARADNFAACTWPVSCLRMPSKDSEATHDGQPWEQDEGDVEAEAGLGSDAEDPHAADAADIPPADEAEAIPATESTRATEEPVRPFISLPYDMHAGLGGTSPLVDQDVSSPMWTWHNNVASFYRCGSLELTPPTTPGTAMPSLPGMTEPLRVQLGLREPLQVQPVLREPRFIPRSVSSVLAGPMAQKQWTNRDSAYVEPSAAFSQIAPAGSLPRSDQPRPPKRQQRQQQQQQQQQLQIQRVDPNRLERRRHPAKKRDTDADASALASEAHTTIMIRNLPNNYSREMLLQLLRSCGLATKCDFVYLPIDFHTQSNLGYAFVNLENNYEARHFWQVFDGFNRWAVRSKKVASLRWSECQGLEANIKRYRNSPVMGETVPSEHKPIVFNRGVQVEFPAPTKALRAPRIKQLASSSSAAASEVGMTQ